MSQPRPPTLARPPQPADAGDGPAKGPAEADDEAALTQLAEAARGSDPAATADLLRALQDTIYRFALSQLRDADAAADATQETAVRLLTAVRRYEGRSRVSTWALGVTLNVCRESRRRGARETGDSEVIERLSSEQVAGEQLGIDGSPEGTAERRDEVARLRQAIDGLPERQREAVVLRQLEGLSTAETADAMGCSEGAVKASLWQGLRRLRQWLVPATEEARP